MTLSTVQGLATAFTRSLAEVRGKTYVAKPGFSLYATSGANDDYAYGRHFVDSSKAKTLAFTVEWGTDISALFPEMEEIIKDVSSGLIGLGLEALGIDSYIVTNRDTFSSYEVETTHAYPTIVLRDLRRLRADLAGGSRRDTDDPVSDSIERRGDHIDLGERHHCRSGECRRARHAAARVVHRSRSILPIRAHSRPRRGRLCAGESRRLAGCGADPTHRAAESLHGGRRHQLALH